MLTQVRTKLRSDHYKVVWVIQICRAGNGAFISESHINLRPDWNTQLEFLCGSSTGPKFLLSLLESSVHMGSELGLE